MRIVVWKSPRILRGLLRSGYPVTPGFKDAGITADARSYHEVSWRNERARPWN